MKYLITSLLLILAISVQAQDRKITKTGHLWFYSHTPLEDIEAHSRQAVAMLITSSGKLAIEVPMISFEFKKALMQEHFNENFVESSKYPKATFNGVIADFTSIDFSKDGIHNVTVSGELTLHNEKQTINPAGTLEIKAGKILIKSNFKVAPNAFKIAIPSAISGKVEDQINVSIELEF